MNDEVKKYYENYDYNSRRPMSIPLEDLRKDQADRLMKDEVFCILPWIHMHGWPTGEAYPCCIFKEEATIGNMREKSMEDIWNDEPIRKIRQDMLAGRSVSGCAKCYEQESLGFFSMRNSSNKHFGHHINDVNKTQADGYHPEFKIRYWDVRFSNICNFRCRYCGPNFSSNWWEDKAALHGKDSIGHNKFLYAGKNKDDIWNQMVEHIPHLEQIYFAGGEPLLMEEHYRLLQELVDRKLTHVRLIYNTNFSELRYKKKNVLELWKLFDSVSVGASLDAMGARAEYMRKGTVWSEIESNRRQMIETCPMVDFYISATVNVFNVLHINDFHRNWVDKGLIKAQDFNVNLLQGPDYYRCDILPLRLKSKAKVRLQETIDWLSDQDHLTRATNGYKGIINFLDAKDNSQLIPQFMKVTKQLDNLRKETFREIFPELDAIDESA